MSKAMTSKPGTSKPLISSRQRTAIIVLLLAVAAIFVASYLVGGRNATGAEAFGGTDSAVTETIESDGYEPWFKPVWEPGSGEVESGLFALQAAIGAGILGYVFGNFRGRAAVRKELTSADDRS